MNLRDNPLILRLFLPNDAIHAVNHRNCIFTQNHINLVICLLLVFYPATLLQYGYDSVCLLSRIGYVNFIVKAHLRIIGFEVVRQFFDYDIPVHSIGDFRLEGIEKLHDTIRILAPVFTCQRLKKIGR